MADFEKPESRNEAILQNMLGADNPLPEEPLSRIEALLMQVLQVLQNIEGWSEASALTGKTLLEVGNDAEQKS